MLLDSVVVSPPSMWETGIGKSMQKHKHKYFLLTFILEARRERVHSYVGD